MYHGSEPYSTTSPVVRCHHCNMAFSSVQQLSMHRDLLCVGSDRQRNRIVQTKASAAQDKIRELQSMKRENLQRSRERDQYERELLSRHVSRQSKYRSSDHRPDHSPARQDWIAAKRYEDSLNQQVAALSEKFHRRLMALRSEKDNLRIARADLEHQLSNLRYNTPVAAMYDIQPEGQVSPQFHPSTDDSDASGLENEHRSTSKNMPGPQAEVVPPRFVFGGGSLVAEISALRQHYITSGGKDPTVITQLNEMLQEAEEMAQIQHQKKSKTPKKNNNNTKTADPILVALELENMRLQKELASYERDDRRENSARDQVDNRRHMQKMLELEKEVELLKFRSNMQQQQYLQPVYQTTQQPTSQTPVQAGHTTIPHIPHPSNVSEDKGFTCFYDFVMGLEHTAQVCKLIVGLFREQRQLGEPVILPTVYTEVTDYGNTAVIGAKQPFPDCPLSSDVHLVVELQTSATSSGDFTTKAWTILNLFQPGTYLNSGVWRIPMRVAPLLPGIANDQLERIPQYEKCFLLVRIANHVDSDLQSNIAISPANHDDYKLRPSL